MSLEKLFEQLQTGGVADLNIVLKGDVQGSVEAIIGELGKIEHPEVRVNVIHTGVGGITENDVNLAAASGAMVVGFNVRPSTEARQLAERQGIQIRQYRVIYKLTEEIQQALRLRLDPVFLPRPLLLVPRLPRNETGKLPREALLKFAEQQARGLPHEA